MAENYTTAPKIDDYTKTKYLDAVTSDLKRAISDFEIASKSITEDMLADDSVTSVTIKEASIESAHITDAAISSAHISTAAIESAHIGNAVIQGAHIKSETVENSHILTGTIDNAKIASATITGAKIALATITTGNIATATITNANIANATITGAKIALATIDNANIKDASITTAKIQDAQIIGAKIAQATIDNANIANATITGAKIASATIDNANIKDASISSAKIQNLAVTTALINDAAITSAKIGTAQILTANIADANITTAKIGDAQITGAKIASATIDNANIKNATIDNTKIAVGTITNALLGTAIIKEANIQDLAVTSAKIYDLTANKITAGTLNTGQVTISGVGGFLKITGNRLQVFDNQPIAVERVSIGDVDNNGTLYGLRVRGADGTTVLYDEKGVYNAGITNGAITNPKIADNSIDSRTLVVDAVIAENISAGAITTTKIATNAITAQSGIIADAAIGSAKIIDASITNAKIGNAQITGGKIANATITGGNIAQATITGSNIVGGTITNALIADATILGAKIADATLTGAKLIDASITTAKIGDAQITNAKIASLDATKITSGYIDAGRIKIGASSLFEDGYDPYDANQSALNANITAGNAVDSANNANATAGDVKMLTDGWLYPDTTYIDGGNIYTGTILANSIATKSLTANQIQAGTITAAEIKTGTITAASGIINDLSATTIKSGTINADLVTISNGKVTLNSAGVTVKDAGFFVTDSVSGTNQNIIPQTNLIVDHSFEMLIAGTLVSGGTYNIANSSDDVWYRWASVGSPKIYNSIEGLSYAPYGNTAAIVNNANKLRQAFPITLGKQYTLSFAVKYPAYGTASKPRAAIQWWYMDANGYDVKHSETYLDFTAPTNNGVVQRQKVTATAPSTLPTGTYWGIVEVSTPDANWAMFDGVQVIQGSSPSIYNPEDEVWRMRRGTDKYSAINNDFTISGDAETLALKGSTHVYAAFYSASDSRSGWVGYGSPTSPTTMTLKNEVGNLNIQVKSGGSIDITATTVDFNNSNIANANHITIADTGGGEGIEWLGGSGWKIVETDDAGTANNTAAPLQFFTGSTRRFTIGTTGNAYVTGSMVKIQNSSGDYVSDANTTLKSDASSAGYGITVGGDGNPRIWSMDIYNRTYASGATVTVTSAGTLGRISSARKYKLEIEDVPQEMPDKIMSLSPKSWFDKAATERYAEYLTKTSDIGMDGQPSEIENLELQDVDIPYLERAYGLIAEEVIDAGLPEYVVWGEADETGKREPEGLMYERLWILLLPVVQKQAKKIEELESRLQALETV